MHEKAIARGEIAQTEIKNNGRIFQFQCVVLPDDGRMLTFYDITSLKKTERELAIALEKVSHLANHDPLTGLPNLRLATERLISAISLSKRKGWKAAIMFIDLDGFKERGRELGGKGLDHGDAAIRLYPFPKLPVTMILWMGDNEFTAQVDFFFDATCDKQLPTDVLWSTGMVTVLAMTAMG